MSRPSNRALLPGSNHNVGYVMLARDALSEVDKEVEQRRKELVVLNRVNFRARYSEVKSDKPYKADR